MRNADRALLTFLCRRVQLDAAARATIEELMVAQKLSAVEALCTAGFLDEAQIAETFREALNLRRVALDRPGPQLPKPLDREMLARHMAVPALVVEGRLVLAMVNPLDQEVIRQVRFASGLHVTPAVATLSEVRSALQRADVHEGSAAAERLAADTPNETAVAMLDAARASPIIKMSDLIMTQALSGRASDVHLEPSAEGLTVRYRIDGILEEVTRLSTVVQRTLVTRFKVMARLDIAERRVPQDGRIEFTFAGRRVDCRVSTLPTQYGEKVVLRLLDPVQSLVELDRLGLEADELVHVEECLRRSEGLIVTTGPTGSGKSTTLYSMLRAIQTPDVNIVTAENPIEYRLPGITQTEVNERQGLSFASVLRSILRQDPDVILVGEIRDRETAEIAIQAAQTGHLVLSTLHTNDAVGAVTRLVNLGIERELIASSLLLVIAQRLVRAVCPDCRQEVPDAPSESSRLAGATLMRGIGCSRCRNTGYRGRIGIYEVFPNSGEAKRLINEGASEIDLRDLVRRHGGRSLTQVALAKLRSGQTTLEEVASILKPEHGRQSCPTCGEQVGDGAPQCPSCSATLGAVAEPAPSASANAPPLASSPPPPSRDLGAHVLTFTAACAPQSPALMGTAVRALALHAGLDVTAAAELEIAVVEAGNLAWSVADSERHGTLEVRLELSSDGCSVEISGDGSAWPWPRPSARYPSLDELAHGDAPEVRAFLIRASADDVVFERNEGINHLWITKRASTGVDGSGTDAVEQLSA